MNSWLGAFSAIVALITVWLVPLSLAAQVVLTAALILVPACIIFFWLGRITEHRSTARPTVAGVEDPPATRADPR